MTDFRIPGTRPLTIITTPDVLSDTAVDRLTRALTEPIGRYLILEGSDWTITTVPIRARKRIRLAHAERGHA